MTLKFSLAIKIEAWKFFEDNRTRTRNVSIKNFFLADCEIFKFFENLQIWNILQDGPKYRVFIISPPTISGF